MSEVAMDQGSRTGSIGRDAIFERAESAARGACRREVLDELRSLRLDEFGHFLWSMPNTRYPALSAMLAAAPSEETQLLWTGASGERLVKESADFLRSIARRVPSLVTAAETPIRVLDYGCGYGRLLRLIEYFIDTTSLFGCDPWDQSLIRCREDRVAGDLRPSDYVPSSLPFDDTSFDLVFAFSVFTHLSERSAAACLGAIRRATKPGGFLAITIRPVEFWSTNSHLGDRNNTKLIWDHMARGFAFLPMEQLPPIDGDIPYGDTSMTLEKLRTLASGWELVGTEKNASDLHQEIVFLRAT